MGNNVIAFDSLTTDIEQSAFDVFACNTPEKLEPYIAAVRDWAGGIDADISTAVARDKLRSEAFKVSRLKSALEKIGAEESRRVKEIPRQIDANRRYLKEQLDEIQQAIRQPLTDWEEAERAAQEKAEQAVQWLQQAQQGHTLTAAEAGALLAEVKSFDPSTLIDPYASAAEGHKERAIDFLQAHIEAQHQADADRAELEQLRKAEAERQRQAEIEQARQQAAAQAQQEAAAEAQRVIDAERAKVQDAERRAKEAEQAKALAVEQERQRIKQEKEAERMAAAARQANREHAKRVNNMALDSLVKLGLTQEQARNVVAAIARGEIKHVTINY